MNKVEISKAASKKSGIVQYELHAILESMVECILDALQQGNDVTIQGFGKFFIKERGERNTRNPRDNTAIVCPPKKVVKFQVTPKFDINQ
jgi:nucleoid DNA-binding protein